MKSVMRPEGGVPVKLWLDDLESSAFDQAYNVARFPDIFKHVAIMPDAHMGMGVPIGCVFATNQVIVPNAVGVDIGCGMTAIKLNVSEGFIRANKQAIYNGVQKNQTLSIRKDSKDPRSLQEIIGAVSTSFLTSEVIANGKMQLGTLGGGNHFIEFQKDKNNNVWLMIHSGSRNLGQKIGKHYDNLAKEFNRKSFSSVDPKHKLAFLHVDSIDGKNYITDMKFGVNYAKANRVSILIDMISILQNLTSKNTTLTDRGTGIIDCSHNFANLENHFGKNVWVHRKGATNAGHGVLGLIPGSQGTSSYIVSGRGNKDSFNSCSHGAGRVLSRSKAKDVLDLEFEQLVLEEKGVIHQLDSRGNLDEAPGAYKDIEKVMDNQSDLVKIVHKLNPILVVKN